MSATMLCAVRGAREQTAAGVVGSRGVGATGGLQAQGGGQLEETKARERVRGPVMG